MYGFTLLTSLFIGGLVIADVLATKIIVVPTGLFGVLIVSAGVLAYSITFTCTDILGEVFGKEKTRKVVMAGFITKLLVLVLMQVSILWPAAGFYKDQAAYETVLNAGSRIVIASIFAYLTSQFTDVWIFSKIKEKTEGRYLWLRNNVSTIISQFIDTVIFITIAFYGVYPNKAVILMIGGQWFIKILVALIDTPFVYAGVNVLRKHSDHS